MSKPWISGFCGICLRKSGIWLHIWYLPPENPGTWREIPATLEKGYIVLKNFFGTFIFRCKKHMHSLIAQSLNFLIHQLVFCYDQVFMIKKNTKYDEFRQFLILGLVIYCQKYFCHFLFFNLKKNKYVFLKVKDRAARKSSWFWVYLQVFKVKNDTQIDWHQKVWF